jgi:hypothetical protein
MEQITEEELPRRLGLRFKTSVNRISLRVKNGFDTLHPRSNLKNYHGHDHVIVGFGGGHHRFGVKPAIFAKALA